MPQKQVVQLGAGDRQQLRSLLRKGKASARCLTRARILLAADDSLTDVEIAEQLDVSLSLIYDVRCRFVCDGWAAAIRRRPQPPRPAACKLDGDGAAHLLALACGAPPDGREVWTRRLWADRLVELKHADTLSHETVRTVLEKNEIKPWLKKQWCIPPEANAAFVCAMEDVLEVYKRPYDPQRPVVCLDETSRQLLSETRAPLPGAPGQPVRADHEYERGGTANLFLAFEPLAGQRHTQTTEPRTKVDWACFMKGLLGPYATATKVVLV